jgi:hypothetical protein
LTPKFDKLTLETEGSADDVKKEESLLIMGYLEAGQEILVNIFFGEARRPRPLHVK